MVRSDRPPTAIESTPVDSLPGCLMRLFTSAGGVVVLMVCGILILRRPAWTFTLVDAAFWLAALALLAAVHFEHRRAATGSARPVLGRLLLACAIWLPAQATQLLP